MLYTYKVLEIVKVIDADTIDLRLDLGFEVSKIVRCRLARIDAPELNTIEGKAFKKLVIDKLATNTIDHIESLKYDRYGRSIAEVYFKDNSNLSSFLIANGCALY